MLTNVIFLLLENFTNSDRTPPYIDTYLQLFPNFGNFGKKLSDKSEPKTIPNSIRSNQAMVIASTSLGCSQSVCLTFYRMLIRSTGLPTPFIVQFIEQ